MKTVSQKMGIKENSRVLFINAPSDAISEMNLPEINIAKRLIGEFDYIHLFVKNKSEYKDKFPGLKPHLKLTGMLWVSWPKGGHLESDLSLHEVIKIGYEFGLVESTCLSINSIWSALKFTHPKKGKVYNNSHAELKSRTTNR
jgi:hypothetical protein